MSPISFIFGVPVGRRMMLIANQVANRIVSTPATGTIQKIGGICTIVPPYLFENNCGYVYPQTRTQQIGDFSSGNR
jgi:hypothetical protein